MQVNINLFENMAVVSRSKQHKDKDGDVDDQWVETKVTIVIRDMAPEAIAELHNIMQTGSGKAVIVSPQMKLPLLDTAA
jgi:hypothetical protein